MRSRFAALAILVAFGLSCGGHWYALQGIAWAAMVKKFSAHVSMAAAVKMAVSGQYPCRMCQAIALKKQDERQQQIKVPSVKKDFQISVSVSLPVRTAGAVDWERRDFSADARFGEPLSPPPRAILL